MGGGNCYCCSLKTGVSVIGWLGLISVIYIIVLIIEGENPIRILTGEQEGAGQPVYITAFYAISAVIQIIINIALLYAVSKRKRVFMLPWLIMTMIFILGIFSILLCMFIYVCAYGDKNAGGILSTISIIGGLYEGPSIWLWGCVLKLYKEFKHETYQHNRLIA